MTNSEIDEKNTKHERKKKWNAHGMSVKKVFIPHYSYLYWNADLASVTGIGLAARVDNQ